MKSDVKKKMILDGHTTRTPKSLKRVQQENFFAQNASTVCRGGDFLLQFREILRSPHL
jgi:hypothetical protein